MCCRIGLDRLMDNLWEMAECDETHDDKTRCPECGPCYCPVDNAICDKMWFEE